MPIATIWCARWPDTRTHGMMTGIAGDQTETRNATWLERIRSAPDRGTLVVFFRRVNDMLSSGRRPPFRECSLASFSRETPYHFAIRRGRKILHAHTRRQNPRLSAPPGRRASWPHPPPMAVACSDGKGHGRGLEPRILKLLERLGQGVGSPTTKSGPSASVLGRASNANNFGRANADSPRKTLGISRPR
jgi:hypothetical protein